MNTSSDAAEQLVRISLLGIEVAARITGSSAKNIAAMLYAISKDQQKMKGKTKLVNMLKSGKELKVFSIKQEDIKKFTEESKRYGVLFSAILEKKNISTDGMIDIIVKAEDAVKINRIVKRFNLAAVDMATVRNEVNQIQNTRNAKEKDRNIKSLEDKVNDEIDNKPIRKESNEISNPQVAKTEKSPLSERSSTSKKSSEQGSNFKKPSVKKQLKEIKEGQEKKLDKTENKIPKTIKSKIDKKKKYNRRFLR